MGFSAYAWLLKATTPARLSTYAYVNPVIAVFLGWAIGGETLTRADAGRRGGHRARRRHNYGAPFAVG